MPELSDSPAVWLQAAATIVLVFVTIYYAWQNRQMARANRDANAIARDTLDEIRRTRVESLRPHLAISLEFFTPNCVKLRVTNLGGGAARELKTNIQFIAADDLYEDVHRNSELGILMPSEHVEFGLPNSKSGDALSAEHLAMHFSQIQCDFSFSDVLGNTHSDTASLKALSDWFESVLESNQKFNERADERIARSLAKLANEAAPVFKGWRRKPLLITTKAILRREQAEQLALVDQHHEEVSQRRRDSSEEE